MVAQVIVNILTTAAIYLLVAISFTLIYYPGKFFHIAHAAIISLSAYLAYCFNSQYHFSTFLSILFSIVLSAAIAGALELLFYKPMRKKKIAPLGLLIASIGLYVVLQNVISLVWGDATLRLNTGIVQEGNQMAGAFITKVQIISVLTSAILFLSIVTIISYSDYGKALRAVSDNPELSNIYGINSNRIILISTFLGSILAAFAGILSAADTNMTPTFGFNLMLYGVVTMIIGGIGSYIGLLGSALLIATAQNLAAYYIDSKWMEAVAYIILIIFLMWKPYGFTGTRLRKIEI